MIIWQSVKKYFTTLADAYTWRFVALLFVIQFFCKGILSVIANNGMFPMFKLAGVSATDLQVYTALAMSPWAMKPLVGVVCDTFSLGGYHKRYWMVIGCLCGIAGTFALIVELHVVVVTVLFFLFIHLEISILDLLSEGKYAEIMGKHPATSSAIITFVNGAQRGGLVVALLFIGPMEDASLFQPLFLIALFAAMAPFFFVLLGWLPEERRHESDEGLRRVGCSTLLFDAQRAVKDRRILAVVAVSGLLSPILSALAAYASRVAGLVFALCALVACTVAAFYAFPPVIARVALFQILFSAGQINIGSAMDYFYTASETCLPGGPHFSYKYYITYTGLISATFSLFAVIAYQVLFGKWRFRSILLFGSVLGIIASMFDLVLIMRWNVAWGVPDKWFYVLGEAIVENVVATMLWIPTSTIIGKVCPPGLEATVYAFIAGVANLGNTVSQIMGAVALDVVGLQTVEPHCNWDALPWLSLVGHTVVPAVVGIPAIWLIPNIRQTDHIYDQPAESTDDDDFELDAMTFDSEIVAE